MIDDLATAGVVDIIIGDELAAGVPTPFGLTTAAEVGGSAGVDGVITFSGSLGAAPVIVSSFSTKPVIGSAGAPEIDLFALLVSGGAGGSYAISGFDDGFTLDPGLGKAAIGGTTDGTLTGTVDQGGTPLFTFGPFVGPTPFSDTAAFPLLSGSTPYGLGLIADIVHGAGDVSSLDMKLEAAVPEPSTLLLLGTGLIGLVGYGRRRKAA